MVMPEISGVIERRLLVNYRVEPAVAARLSPSGLRPHRIAVEWDGADGPQRGVYICSRRAALCSTAPC